MRVALCRLALTAQTSQVMEAIARNNVSALDAEPWEAPAWEKYMHQQKRLGWLDDDEEHCSPFAASMVAPLSSTKTFRWLNNTDVQGPSPHEMFDVVVSLYSKETYAYSVLDTVDILQRLQHEGLLPATSVSEAVTVWFVSPAVAWRHRGALSLRFGSERWAVVGDLLRMMLDELDRSGWGATRACTGAGLHEDWVTFLRASAACAVDDFVYAPFVPAVIHAAVTGDLRSASIPGELRDRAYTMGTMLVEIAVEYGSMVLLNLALDIFQGQNFPVTYETMRRVQQVFSKHDRRRQDHRLRASGEIGNVVHRWLSMYLPRCVPLQHSGTPRADNDSATNAAAPSLPSEVGVEARTDASTSPTEDLAATNAAAVQAPRAFCASVQLQPPEALSYSVEFTEEELQTLRRLTQSELEAESARVGQRNGRCEKATGAGMAPPPRRNSQQPLFTDNREPVGFFEAALLRQSTAMTDARHRLLCEPLATVLQPTEFRDGIRRQSNHEDREGIESDNDENLGCNNVVSLASTILFPNLVAKNKESGSLPGSSSVA